MDYTIGVQLSVQFLALGSVLYHKYHYRKSTNGFLFYMIMLVMVECTAAVLHHFHRPNLYIYNVFSLLSFSFLFWWFRSVLENKQWIILTIYSLFLGSYLYSIFTLDINETLFPIPLMIGTVGIIIVSGLYFYDLLRSDEVIYFMRLKEFWITVGLLLFYVAFLPLFLFQQVLFTRLSEFALVIMILNIILYVSFSYAFLVKPPNPLLDE